MPTLLPKSKVKKDGPGAPRTSPHFELGKPRGGSGWRVVVKTSPEWEDWLRGFSESTGQDCQDLIATGLAMYANSIGYTASPPRKGRKSG